MSPNTPQPVVPIALADHGEPTFTLGDVSDLLEPGIELAPAVRDRLRRATQIRSVAESLPGPARVSLRRRACEVEFEAFLLQKANERRMIHAAQYRDDDSLASSPA